MLYSRIIGQNEAKERLKHMVSERRVPHALLFTGRPGSGNLPLAFAFAQHLFCSNPGPEGACGQCSSCDQADRLVHPDLHAVFPIAKIEDRRLSDHFIHDFRDAFLTDPYMDINYWFSCISSENKQPLIGVDEAYEILRKLSYTSFQGAYKVMIIWLPEKMNQEASNKLLKILEEPPDETIFILVSDAPDQLLATILSRVQQIPLVPNTEEEIAGALMQYNLLGREEALQRALLADGSYWNAVVDLSSDHEGDGGSFLTHFQEFMRLALRFDCAKALVWVDTNAAMGREKHKQFLQYGLEIFRDALMFNYGDRGLVRLDGPAKSFLEKFAPFIHQHNYEALVEEFNGNYYNIERNANPKILFLDLLLKVNELINRK
jgi:DNA polymerase III subunit delta'